MKKGLTLLEILIVFTIFVIILSIGFYSFSTSRRNASLDGIANSIASTLELAKTNAMSGKNGQSSGVAFDANSYVYFSGNSYNPSDSGNKVYTVDSGYLLSNNLSSGNSILIFSRISGNPQATGTITITDSSDSSKTERITIESLGNIVITK
jgi:prepilin-type N-terminal cleavage/methylation domain-containing protein